MPPSPVARASSSWIETEPDGRLAVEALHARINGFVRVFSERQEFQFAHGLKLGAERFQVDTL